MAVAIIARATNRRINRHVAVTGELQPDGRLRWVAGLPAKLRAVVAHNHRVQPGLVADVPIPDVVLPEANRVDVDPDEWRAHGIELHFAATLHEALLSHILLDPWEGILQALLAMPSPDVKLAVDDLAGIAARHRTVLHRPFAIDGAAVLHAMARDLASKRLTGQQAAVPVVLRLLLFAHHSAIDVQILSQLQAHYAPARAGAIDLALVRRELRRGAMSLLFSGLDDLDKADAPPAFLWEILAQLSNPPYARNPAVFACRQSTWAWAARALEQATPAFAHHILARGRSTFLDRHPCTLLQMAAGRIALCRPTWGQRGVQETRVPLPSAEEFFYGGTDDFPEPWYLPLQVREIFPDGTPSEAKPLAQMIAGSADGWLKSFEGQPGLLRTLRIDDLALDAAQLRGYLRRVLGLDALVEVLLAAFQLHTDLPRTPRLLSVCISLARQYSIEEPLIPDRLYRAVLATCLEDEIHVRGKPRLAGLTPPAGVSFVQMAMGFFDVLTGSTARHGRTFSPAEARDILTAFLGRCLAPGGRLRAWWPLTAYPGRRSRYEG